MAETKVVIDDQFWEKAKQDESKFGKYLPTIFVSCGGTGAKVFERVRRHTVERFGSLDSKDLPGVAYVSIDTDLASANAGHQQDDVSSDDPMLKVISYRPEERVNLDGSRVKSYIESEASLKAQPHIAEWFDPQLMTMLQKMDIGKGAGQVRPVARLVAFDNSEQVCNAVSFAHHKVTQLADGGKRVISGDKVNVVICGSFAGGTGSGIFLDIAAMVRNTLLEKAIITGYFVLPDVFTSTGKDGVKLMANGYACLSELSYYSDQPYRVRWQANDKAVNVNSLYDSVYLFGGKNESGQSIRNPGDIYNVVGDALFMDFSQGNFSFARSATQVNRVQTLAQYYAPPLPAEVKRRNAGPDSGPPTQIDTVKYRQRFCSMGMSRLAVSSWRALNEMSYSLAIRLLQSMDNRSELTSDASDLVREFAKGIGIYQGLVMASNLTQVEERQIEVALLNNPREGGVQGTINESIARHFADFMVEDARKQWWDDKNCGETIRVRFRRMEEKWVGAFDEQPKAEFVKRILENKSLLRRHVTDSLQSVIEQFCEKPHVGPHRVALVIERLIDNMKTQDPWIKEMDRRAEEERIAAERALQDWESLHKLVAEADSGWSLARLNKGAWQGQLEQAHDAAVRHWTAVASRKMYIEAAAFMRDIVEYLRVEGVIKQQQLSSRMAEIITIFDNYAKGYRQARNCDVYNEAVNLLDEGGRQRLETFYLGNSEADKDATLRRLFEKIKGERLNVRTNKELREFIETDRERFVRELRYCCWIALRGVQGKTDSFGEIKSGLIEQFSVLTELANKYQSPQHPAIKELALDTLKKALPWVQRDNSVNLTGVKTDIYVVMPPGNPAVGRAIFEAIDTQARVYFKAGQETTISQVPGSDGSEIVVYVETTGLIPACVASMHGQGGMAASFRSLDALRRGNDVRGFLHLERDVMRFPPLVPPNAADVERLARAWRVFLLGVLTGVVRTKRNAFRTVVDEQVLYPMFYFENLGDGRRTTVELGQVQTAINDLSSNQATQSALTEMVNQHYVGQRKEKYERLLALAEYYRLCIFPAVKPDQDAGQETTPRATLAYLALEAIQGELIRQWRAVTKSSDAEAKTLVDVRVPNLIWALCDFAQHAGVKDDDAALVVGKATEKYRDQPVPNSKFSDGGDSREQLRMMVYDLLPVRLRSNPDLRHEELRYPWLRLSPRYLFNLPSKNPGWTPSVNDPAAASRLDEYAMEEAAIALVNAPPADTQTSGGAQFWDAMDGVFTSWTVLPGLKESFSKRGGVIQSGGAVPGGVGFGGYPPPPGQAGGAFPPPPSTVTLTYSGPTAPQPTSLPVAQIAANVQANPASQHYVFVNNAWANAAEHPDVRAALTPAASAPIPPPPGIPTAPPSLPGLPPLGVLPGLPVAPPVQAPIPNVQLHYAGGAVTTWTMLSGEQIVQYAKTLPVGQEGFVWVNGASVPVSQVPDLYAAIQTRRT